MPVISVIVPVYKVEQYLHRCVDSILGQTFEDFQLILVDDGSPDRCGEICEEYAKKDSRIMVIHQENGGLSAARNTGIDWAFANSDSQWLFFVDSDDFIHPETLQRLLDAAETYGTDISIGGFARSTGFLPDVKEESLRSTRWIPKDFFIQHNLEAIVAWGKLYRKNLFLDIRYPMGKIHEDEFTTYKLLFKSSTVAVIPGPLYAYYVNDTGITGSHWSPKRLDALDAFRERIQYFRDMHDKELLIYTIRTYAYLISRHYEQAIDYPELRASLKKQLRHTLIQKKRHFPFRSDAWLYSIAFPRIYSVLHRLAKT